MDRCVWIPWRPVEVKKVDTGFYFAVAAAQGKSYTPIMALSNHTLLRPDLVPNGLRSFSFVG
jgi:hypothetical protein